MSDILKELSAYPDEASVIMSKRVVADVIDEIARLRVERDALRARLVKARKALEPIAATHFSHGASDLDTAEVDIMHLRRARSVYEKIKGGGDE